MNRYFVNNATPTHFILEGDNFHHAKNVVRLKLNEIVTCIFDEVSYEGQISEINLDNIVVKKIKVLEQNEKKYFVTMVLGLIREQKWDFVLQKAVELGVDVIVPVMFNRNVVKITRDKEQQKINRWKKIMEDASEQSYKIKIPNIEPVVRDLNDLKKYLSDVNICCYEEGKQNSLQQMYEGKNNFTFVVGPEGGLEKSEVEKMESLGFQSVLFSKNILRAETVPLYLLSTLMFNFE
jgi:16S rRNA (uracil1498-N3)-methyltransferase